MPLGAWRVGLTGDPHIAQDLVQETMVRVQLNWRRVARADIPDRYVRRMLTNQYVDWRRGSWMRRVLLRAEPDDAAVRPGGARPGVEPGRPDRPGPRRRRAPGDGPGLAVRGDLSLAELTGVAATLDRLVAVDIGSSFRGEVVDRASYGRLDDERSGPVFAAIRDDDLGEWVSAHPEAVAQR